jgi:transcriptional regulator with XRE-family HTH domain
MKNETNLRNQLKYWRKRRGFTIDHLAEVAGVSTATIAKMERDPRHIPRPDVINRLTDKLSVTTDQLIVDESEPESDIAA